MTIDSLKDLSKLIALCRKTGVDTIKVDGMEITLGIEPTALKKQRRSSPRSLPPNPYGEIDENTNIMDMDSLTPEQMLFYSAQGHVPTDEGGTV